MQIKTCQDCDQLRPFTVKRTCPAKNRANSDIIESFFQEDPCMDLASRLIWRCFIETPSNESARKSKFCQIIWVTFITLWFHEFFNCFQYCQAQKFSADFSVKSSWEVRWIVMFQMDAVCNVVEVWWLYNQICNKLPCKSLNLSNALFCKRTDVKFQHGCCVIP